MTSLPEYDNLPASVDVYDVTLRDGAQQEGINLTVADKLAIAELLDSLGVAYIEGGWPGAIPKDTELFERAAKELTLKHATLVAFGATRKAGITAEDDTQLRGLLDSGASVINVVAKSDIRHVKKALRTTPEENLDMIRDTVRFLTSQGRRVFVDAEHAFDGYVFDPEYMTSTLRAAVEAGAEAVVLCDTNGGMLPDQVARIVAELRAKLGDGAVIGIHAHNDTGCAVANTVAAVQAGAGHVEGTMNGYGERTGNVDLLPVIANLELKLGVHALPEGKIAELTPISHAVSELTNIPPQPRQPYVGVSAFAHKAGLHASAIRVDPNLYQHIDPAIVGNDMRMLVSEMAGRASIELKGRELGFDLSGNRDALGNITNRIKEAEARGYTYDAADASFELVLREELGERPTFFTIESWKTTSQSLPGYEGALATEATVKVHVGGRRLVAIGEGNGPVDALDHALRHALGELYPAIGAIELDDYKVRILESQRGTDAITRVLIEFSDGKRTWRTVGVAENVIEASWEALIDSLDYGLIHAGVKPFS